MAYVIAAVVLIGLMAAANLLFTFGVIRRLREQTRELAELRDGRVDRFFAGFFSMTCGACHERLPSFLAFAAARPGGRDRLLAVVAGPAEAAVDLIRQLEPVATVVVEPERGPIQQAFEVTGFPAFVLVRDGVAEASSYDLSPVANSDSAVLIDAG